MDTQTIIDNAARCGLAWQRGHERGRDDERQNCYNDAPLSGEWSGGSIPELLGDLIDEAETEWRAAVGIGDQDPMFWSDVADMGALTDELIEHYEQGYIAAFADRSFCDRCGVLIDATYGIADDSGLAWCGDECANAE